MNCRYQLELKEDYVKRTEKLTDNEKRNQGVCVVSPLYVKDIAYL